MVFGLGPSRIPGAGMMRAAASDVIEPIAIARATAQQAAPTWNRDRREAEVFFCPNLLDLINSQ